MTTGQTQQATNALAVRLAAALGLVMVVALLYGLLGAAGIVPLPRSVSALAAARKVGHGNVLVRGYYLAQPFVSFGGPKLPPYTFSATTSNDAPAVHVTPALEDLHAGRMEALIDTATGDGSRESPYTIHTLMAAGTFASVVMLGALLLFVIAFFAVGPLLDRRPRSRA
ncbi:MAG: hypothetical protein M3Z37_08630 [Candidatus Eremiobacteraeota bacterium]|nr:hypothetical protein [Candidatus Eremiobacteraeota bacterium]